MQKTPICSETYKIASFMLNLQGRAGPFSIVNLIQDIGWLHAIRLGIRQPKNLGWVFTRQVLTLQRYPVWHEELTIRTWLRAPGKDPFLYRDYELFIGEQKIGQCTSTFAVMDLQLRKLAPQDWSQYPDVWRHEACLTAKPGKIELPVDVKDLIVLQVRNSDIDSNNHVNNTRYAQWILDAVPIQLLRSPIQVSKYEINFLAEAKLGDAIRIQKSTSEGFEGPNCVVHFQGLLEQSQKIAFAARLSLHNMQDSQKAS